MTTAEKIVVTLNAKRESTDPAGSHKALTFGLAAGRRMRCIQCLELLRRERQ